MIYIHEILLTIYFWLVTAITFMLTFIICIIVYPFLEQKTFTRVYERIAGYIILKSMTLPGFWSFTIINLHDTDFNDRYIFISNHGSFIDSLLLGQIPCTKKYIMSKTYYNVPLFGRLCEMSGHVFVNKHDKNSTQTAVDKCKEAMKDGSSFVLYPGGRRSDNPYTLLPFKTGAFRLSQSTGVPIIPLVIKGTGVGMGIGGICRVANLEIIVGHPLLVGSEGSGQENVQKAITETRLFIQEHLSQGINGESNLKLN